MTKGSQVWRFLAGDACGRYGARAEIEDRRPGQQVARRGGEHCAGDERRPATNEQRRNKLARLHLFGMLLHDAHFPEAVLVILHPQ